MNRRGSVLACVLAGLLAAACAAKHPSPPPSSSPFAAIEYRRTGGLAGVDDRISVSRGGLLEVRNRQGRHAKAQLSPGDLKEMDALFAGWRELAKSDRPKPAASDAFEYEITYDGIKVTAVEFGAPAPETFDLVRKRLEGLAERAR